MRLRAAARGMWRSVWAARRTRRRTSGVTDPVLLSARETDAIETRARRATSLIVAATSSPQQPRCESGHVRGK